MRRHILIWGALAATVCAPLIAAAHSPLLAWRDPIYVLAGFAGILAMGLLVAQPFLATHDLPGLARLRGRHAHRALGLILVGTVAIHVGGLWITSPPDVIDALLFRSPTPFAIWGVLALWALLGAGLLGVLRRRLRLSPRRWRIAHFAFATVVVLGTIAHALLIQGTMEVLTKWALSAILIISLVLTAQRIGLVGFKGKDQRPKP